MPPEFYPEWIKSEVKIEGLDDEFWKKALNHSRPGIHIDPKYADVLAKQLIDWNNLPEGLEIIGLEILVKSGTSGWGLDGFFYRDGQWVYADFDQPGFSLPEIQFYNTFQKFGPEGVEIRMKKWVYPRFEVLEQIFSPDSPKNALAVELTLYDTQANVYYEVLVEIKDGVANPMLVGAVSP